jgi:hypothetical protein
MEMRTLAEKLLEQRRAAGAQIDDLPVLPDEIVFNTEEGDIGMKVADRAQWQPAIDKRDEHEKPFRICEARLKKDRTDPLASACIYTYRDYYRVWNEQLPMRFRKDLEPAPDQRQPEEQRDVEARPGLVGAETAPIFLKQE